MTRNLRHNVIDFYTKRFDRVIGTCIVRLATLTRDSETPFAPFIVPISPIVNQTSIYGLTLPDNQRVTIVFKPFFIINYLFFFLLLLIQKFGQSSFSSSFISSSIPKGKAPIWSLYSTRIVNTCLTLFHLTDSSESMSARLSSIRFSLPKIRKTRGSHFTDKIDGFNFWALFYFGAQFLGLNVFWGLISILGPKLKNLHTTLRHDKNWPFFIFPVTFQKIWVRFTWCILR